MNDITPHQALIIWCLLGKYGQALQSEIVPQVKKKDREALEASGFVSCEKRERAFFLKVEDSGWRWASEHLRDELPQEYQVLQHWLTQIHNFLDKNDETLAGFIGPAPEMPADSGLQTISAATPKRKRAPAKKPKVLPKTKKPPSEKVRKTAGKKPTKRPKPPTEKKLRDLIENAYLAATKGQMAVRVLLSEIRSRLTDIDRPTLDKALTRLHERDRAITLMRLDNPKEITASAREAQLMFKGEPLHLLWIER